MFNFRSTLLIVFLLVSVISALSMVNLFNFWMIVELNMLFFLLFLKIEENIKIMLKYFMIQAFSSGIFIWAFFFLSFKSVWLVEILFMSSFLIKLGASPFHAWMLNLLKSMKWFSIISFASVQKVIPLYGVYCIVCQQYKFVSIMLCLIVAIQGIFNTYMMKKMIGYSSIFSLAWMMSSENFYVILIYLFFYFLNLWALFTFLEFSSNDTILNFQEFLLSKKVGVILSFLSMAGLPPFLGFVGKIYIIWNLLESMNNFLFLSLVMSSLFALFLYLRLSIFFLTLSSTYFILSTQVYSKLEYMIFSLILLPIFILLLSVMHKKIWFFKM